MAEFDRLAQLLGVLSLAATDRFRTGVEASLGRGGEHAGALVHLEAHPGGSVEALRAVLGISQPGTLALVRRLEDDGLLEVGPGPDRRSRSLRLSGAGRAAAAGIRAARARELETLLEPLTPAERERLEPLMAKLVSSLAEDRPGALRVCRMCDRDSCCEADTQCPLQHTVVAA